MSAGKADDDPIAIYEGQIGSWRAGRYIGEVQFENGVLRIEPRFGMPNLLRWLGEIWGVKLLDSSGAWKDQNLWFWFIIAHLWNSKLIAAAKHGLPYRRSDTVHTGMALRGKLLPLKTALIRAVRDEHLVSNARIRLVDHRIGSIVLLAAQDLNRVLLSKGPRPSWIPLRGAEILNELRTALGSHINEPVSQMAHSIRYTPINEGYRPLVNLSLSILSRKQRSPSIDGTGTTHGLLLDMAEIWELYVAKLLRAGLSNLRVSHTGRTNNSDWCLLKSKSGKPLQSLRPDIIISDGIDRCLAIVDAKYKNTRSGSGRVNGVSREDLYQLSAYLAAFGNSDDRLDGFLIYPEDPFGQVATNLSSGNPWQVTSGQQRHLWFLSVDGLDVPLGTGFSTSENAMVEAVEVAIKTIISTG